MELGLPLKLAGKMREPREREYFAEFVEPHLGNGIEYLGEVNHGTKVELLQNARTTLFPIEWEEPFGLVMIESMACGTPVIATRHGAVPEVMGDGRGGIVVDHWREIPQALERADEIDPLECRRYVEEPFAPQRAQCPRGYHRPRGNRPGQPEGVRQPDRRGNRRRDREAEGDEHQRGQRVVRRDPRQLREGHELLEHSRPRRVEDLQRDTGEQ